MRQVIIQVPSGHGLRACSLLEHHRAVNVVRIASPDPTGTDLVIGYVSNRELGAALSALEELPNLRVGFMPLGAVALHPPPDQASDQVLDVSPLSPLEFFVSGLQSIGSWKGFLSYAVISGVVAWAGLFTDTAYLLVAAMLIAPYASPAMNLALATARGDVTLIVHSIGRYFASLGTAIAVASCLTWALRVTGVTPLMTDIANLSTVAVFLPLVAGAAGALHLILSERSSLVSGAAVGMLVAASLAPPAALIGMGIALGEGDLAVNALFIVLLQLVGINLTGSVLYRLYGLTPRGVRFSRGRASASRASFLVSLACLGGLLGWQFVDAPDLQRASLARRAAADAQRAIRVSGLAVPVEVRARFPRAELPGKYPLVVTAYVQKVVSMPDDALERRLSSEIRRALEGAAFPLIEVTVLDAHSPAASD
jgi:uncharacterized hydrophobic protein (TIGR00271 family)